MFNDNGIGRFTYYSPNGSSTIDYLILNEDNIISKFEVLPKLVQSDHCPIQFNISNTKLDDHDDYNHNNHNSERTRELGPEGPQLAGASSYSNGCQQGKAKAKSNVYSVRLNISSSVFMGADILFPD